MDISVVVPLYNEEESLPELYAWIERVMKAHGFSYEVIFVNDGSTDRSWQIIEELSRESDAVHGIKFRRNYGKSPALYCGLKRHKEMLSLQWMQIYRIARTKYPNYTG